MVISCCLDGVRSPPSEPTTKRVVTTQWRRLPEGILDGVVHISGRWSHRASRARRDRAISSARSFDDRQGQRWPAVHVHRRADRRIGRERGDIVLCRVKGAQYLHLVKAVQGERFQIGNSRGGINGWVTLRQIFGRLVRVV